MKILTNIKFSGSKDRLNREYLWHLNTWNLPEYREGLEAGGQNEDKGDGSLQWMQGKWLKEWTHNVSFTTYNAPRDAESVMED